MRALVIRLFYPSPDTPTTVVVVLIVVVLIAIVEVLFPGVVGIVLRRTPIIYGRCVALGLSKPGRACLQGSL